MTVTKYEACFNFLASIEKYLVIQDLHKATKVLMGLWDDIHMQIMYQGVRTYHITIFVAYKVETINLEHLKVANSSQNTNDKGKEKKKFWKIWYGDQYRGSYGSNSSESP